MKIVKRNRHIDLLFMIWIIPLMGYILRKIFAPETIVNEEIYFYAIPLFMLFWFIVNYKIIFKPK